MELAPFIDILKESIILTLTVIALMCIIEAVNFNTQGRMLEAVRGRKGLQYATAALLGAVPGCFGGFFAVSFYSKRMFTFGALLSMAVATTGDEAFVMLAMFPKTALLIFLGLVVLGIICGMLQDAFSTGYIDKDAADCDCSDEENESGHKSLRHRLLHTIKHGLKIFLWTFCIMAIVEVAGQHIDIAAWADDNAVLMIALASLIGCIPQSGPHLVFVTLFASGVIPFPVLLASCISQDGHAGIPLMVASRKDFFRLKAVKVILAMVAGCIALLF